MSNVKIKDFFVIYNSADEDKATWIAEALEDAGYGVIIRAWDFLPGQNFVLKMDQALKSCKHVLAVVSHCFLQALYTAPEWAEAFRSDPIGDSRRLIPVYIEENLKLEGLLGPIIKIDISSFLKDRNLNRAKEELLNGLAERERKSSLTDKQNSCFDGLTLDIKIDTDGVVKRPSDGECLPYARWIAYKTPSNVSFVIHDDRIQGYEEQIAAAEKEFADPSYSSEHATHHLSWAVNGRRMVLRRNRRLEKALRIFSDLNRQYDYIHFNSPNELALFIDEMNRRIENEYEYWNSEDTISVDFTLKGGKFYGYHFVVRIKKTAIMAAGLSDELNFFDLPLLTYDSFDEDTKRIIIAAFCESLEWEEERDFPVRSDVEAQCLWNYEIGLH